jgi:restriction endonuclease S subunit
MDDSLSIDTVEKIFLELLNSFPKDKFNKEFSVLLIKVCVNIINKDNRIVLSKTVQNKVDKYFEITNVFNFGKERSFPYLKSCFSLDIRS